VLDLLAAVVVVPLLVALGLAALYAVTVVPFLAALALADRAGLAPGRWAAASLVAVGMGLGLAGLALRAGASWPLALLALAVAFLPAAVLGAGGRIGPAAGRHERPL